MNASPEPPLYTLTPGQIPLLVSIPHGGQWLPGPYAERMTPAARAVADTDWHLGRLYAFAREMGASVIQATHSRYVIDLNRPPDGQSLYPGQTTTGLCPAETFRGEALYLPGDEPGEAERTERLTRYWRPYHDALGAELDRLRGLHGQVLLWEAHSIASVLPRLFEGRLPDLNIGTNGGASCAPAVHQAVAEMVGAAPFTSTVDGRFKGGYITRHYGRPDQGIHAVQLEMAQCLYMDEAAPFAYREDGAARVQPTLRALLQAAWRALPPVSPTH